MKKIVFLFIAILFSLITFAQEKKEMRLELNSGTTVTGQVQMQIDGSYLIETPSGDLFLFSPSEVKKAMVLGAPVNTGANGGSVYKKGGKLFFADTGVPLSQTDFSTFKDWDKYQGARAWRKTGNALLISGVGLIGAGAVVAFVVPRDWVTVYYEDGHGVVYGEVGGIYGGVTMIVGTSMAVASLACSIIGNAKLKKIERAYNLQPGYAIDFGAQQHGIGFALNF